MSDNDYDSRHETRRGGACPGENIVQCTSYIRKFTDDPDVRLPDVMHTLTNDQNTTQIVYFMVDAYSSENGAFSLEWSITGQSAEGCRPPPTALPKTMPTLAPPRTAVTVPAAAGSPFEHSQARQLSRGGHSRRSLAVKVEVERRQGGEPGRRHRMDHRDRLREPARSKVERHHHV